MVIKFFGATMQKFLTPLLSLWQKILSHRKISPEIQVALLFLVIGVILVLFVSWTQVLMLGMLLSISL